MEVFVCFSNGDDICIFLLDDKFDFVRKFYGFIKEVKICNVWILVLRLLRIKKVGLNVGVMMVIKMI